MFYTSTASAASGKYHICYCPTATSTTITTTTTTTYRPTAALSASHNDDAPVGRLGERLYYILPGEFLYHKKVKTISFIIIM